jgi:hypothetical protein
MQVGFNLEHGPNLAPYRLPSAPRPISAAEARAVHLQILHDPLHASAQGHCDNPTLANEFIFD